MRVIIAGSRTVTNPLTVPAAVEASGFTVTTLVCGMALGADRLGYQWAVKHGITVVKYHAEWDTYGNAAGRIRNGLMARNADALIAIWDGSSRGTADMIKKAEAAKLLVYIHLTY